MDDSDNIETALRKVLDPDCIDERSEVSFRKWSTPTGVKISVLTPLLGKDGTPEFMEYLVIKRRKIYMEYLVIKRRKKS